MNRACLKAFALLLAGSPVAALGQDMDHSAHQMDHGAVDHGQTDQDEAEHAGHDAVGTDAKPGNAPPPPIDHGRASDRYFGAAAMAAAEATMMRAHGSSTYGKLTFDLAEYRFRNGRDGYHWEAEGWIGDLDRFVIKSKGGGVFNEGLEHGEVQALYAKALDPWWNLQAGVRQDLAPGPVRTHATVGIEGRAPYQFEVQAAAFLSHKGEVTARVEGSYDQRITQRLILQPRAEIDFSAQDIADYHLGSGVTSAELALRLRYEIRREFAPYIGVAWTWLAGGTADIARAEGHDPSERSLVAGVRIWF